MPSLSRHRHRFSFKCIEEFNYASYTDVNPEIAMESVPSTLCAAFGHTSI